MIFEATPLDSDEPCALAAHLPPNLMILLLHYMPESSPRIDIPDEIQVRQQAHFVVCLPHLLQTCSCVYVVTCVCIVDVAFIL